MAEHRTKFHILNDETGRAFCGWIYPRVAVFFDRVGNDRLYLWISASHRWTMGENLTMTFGEERRICKACASVCDPARDQYGRRER